MASILEEIHNLGNISDIVSPISQHKSISFSCCGGNEDQNNNPEISVLDGNQEQSAKRCPVGIGMKDTCAGPHGLIASDLKNSSLCGDILKSLALLNENFPWNSVDSYEIPFVKNLFKITRRNIQKLVQLSEGASIESRLVMTKKNQLEQRESSSETVESACETVESIGCHDCKYRALALPPWVPDSFRNTCSNCGSKFSLLNRRHHCRSCGNLFDKKCSSNYTHVPIWGFKGDVRVCDRCYTRLKQRQSTTVNATYRRGSILMQTHQGMSKHINKENEHCEKNLRSSRGRYPCQKLPSHNNDASQNLCASAKAPKAFMKCFTNNAATSNACKPSSPARSSSNIPNELDANGSFGRSTGRKTSDLFSVRKPEATSGFSTRVDGEDDFDVFDRTWG